MSFEQQQKRKRIYPELIDLVGDRPTPMESVIGPDTAHLDKKFERVLRPIQKEYIQNQTDLYEEEHVLLDGIMADMRDLLQHMHEYQMREVPHKNLDLFCELGYKSFKKRQECNFLMKLIEQQSELFYEEMFPPIASEENEEDEEDLDGTVHI